MRNLKLECAELLLTNSVEKMEIDELIEDATKLYDWVKDCPAHEQSLKFGSCKLGSGNHIELASEDLYRLPQLSKILKSKPDDSSQSDCTDA